MNTNIIQVNETQTSVRIFCAGNLPFIIEDWHKKIIQSFIENNKNTKNEITDNSNSITD